jgi:hypothetical protein
MFQSSFLNHHLFVDHISKLSLFDSFLVSIGSNKSGAQLLYSSVMYDILLDVTSLNISLVNLMQAEYQEILSTIFLLTPELSLMCLDYFTIYNFNDTMSYLPSAVFDSYISNNNFFFSEGIISFLMFWFYS